MKEEQCKNCEQIYNGSIIKVDKEERCVFCGRKVGSNNPTVDKLNTPSQSPHKQRALK